MSSGGVSRTSAPNARSSAVFSGESTCGAVATIGMPSCEQIAASAMPVLPEVASMTVLPSSSPRSSRPLSSHFAVRSLIEPNGLTHSHFT